MLVVDASVLATALIDDTGAGEVARARLRGSSLLAPELLDLEVVSVLRRQLLAGELDSRRAALALQDLADLPVTRVPHRKLIPRCWELRQNLTVYDAAYVAVAELFGTALLTADRRLAKAPGLRCEVEVIS